ncbi:MAG: hypothetical protein ACXWXZ_20105 [Candidatus Binatia bacterium]
MNLRILPVIGVVAALLLTPLKTNAQSVDAKLAVLEKLTAAERQHRMPAHTKVKSPESQLIEGQDVRMPDIFDMGRRYQAIGNRYRETFPALDEQFQIPNYRFQITGIGFQSGIGNL